MFKFEEYLHEHSEAACQIGGITYHARIYRDPDASAPDQRQDGFWPSLDPENLGYVGPEVGPEEFKVIMDDAQSVYDAWKRDEWWYCGVAISAFLRDGTQLVDSFNHSMWGIECNYPGSKNQFVSDCANELLKNVAPESRLRAMGVAQDALLAAEPTWKERIRIAWWVLTGR